MSTIDKKIYVFTILLAVLILLPFVVLCFYTFPSADDFSSAFMVREAGFWDYQRLIYTNWTGRYTANILEALNPMIWGWEWGYKLVPLLMMGLLYFAFRAFSISISGNSYSKKDLSLASLVFFGIYLNIFPGISEGLYWMTGVIEYLLANILTLLMLAVLIKINGEFANRMKRMFMMLIAIILAIAIVGLNEISVLLIFEIVSLYLIFIYVFHRKMNLQGIGILLVIVGGAIFEVTAPGNFERMKQFDQNFSLLPALWGALKSLMKLAGIFIQNPPFLILSLLFLPLAMREPKEGSVLSEILRIKPWLLLIVSVLILYSLYLPSYLGMGINPPMRVHALIALVFIILWMINLFAGVQRLRIKGIKEINLPPWAVYFLIICVFIFVATDFVKEPAGAVHYRGNIARAWSDMIFRAPSYNKQMNSRIQEIETIQKSQSDIVYVNPIKDPPSTIFFVDMTDDTENWINFSVSKYYGCGPVALRPACCSKNKNEIHQE
jgi:hypothetical protein